MVAAVADPKVVGAQRARILVEPKGRDHSKWGEVREFIAATGTELDPWQLRVIRTALRRRAGAWAAFAVGVCAPRQNGKNAILEMRELVGCLVLGEKLVIHTAHLADTSKEAFRRLDDLIDANDWLSREVKHIWRTNGHESIEFRNGNRIRFRTRTRGGGRGFAGTPVIFDESMFLSEISMGAILPVVSAQPDPQVWYMGSAVDQSIHDEGVAFARVRDRALTGADDRLAYFEWSLDADSPDDVGAAEAGDVRSWAATNPALGIRISPGYLKAEMRELDPRTFSVERLGVGDWPPVDGSAGQVIPVAKWDLLADDPAAERSRLEDPICLAFDVTPDRSMSAIVAAGRRSDGFRQVEVTDHRPGTNWVVSRLGELQTRHSPLVVMCDAMGPAGSLLYQCDEAGVDVVAVTASDHGRACGVLYDLVDEQELRHLGSADLRDAIRGAIRRPLGDAWAWSRKSSTVDISPLVAATLALWGTETTAWNDTPVIW